MKYIKAKAKHIIRRCLAEKTNEDEKVSGYSFEINQLIDEAYQHGLADKADEMRKYINEDIHSTHVR